MNNESKAHPKTTSGKPAAVVRAGQDVLLELRTNEVFIAIVGPAGAGAGTVVDAKGLSIRGQMSKSNSGVRRATSSSKECDT